ncbi:MAG: hypothetical protein O3C20_00875 [Verrucomicrobia bacterium]|nr:hypothetical protein [Verrucomicrobiota bacterium]
MIIVTLNAVELVCRFGVLFEFSKINPRSFIMFKKQVFAALVALSFAALFSASAQAAHHKSSNSVTLSSAGSIAFGPDGILVVVGTSLM